MKRNIFKILSLSLITGSSISILLTTNIINQTGQFNLSNLNNNTNTKTIDVDAKLLGADKGKIELKVHDNNECFIIAHSSDFYKSGD